MAPPLFLHENREPGCFGVLADQKYYHVDNLFIKRTLRKTEWIEIRPGRVVTPSAALAQRFRTDVAVQRYLRAHTNIPLPAFAPTFEDDGAMYLVVEFVEGVGMNELPEKDRKVVEKELQQHLETLKSLRSDTPGVPGEQLMVAPQRVSDMSWNYHTCWRPCGHVKGEFVFCHNDLGQHNVLVDPKTLKITAIIDWEFGGFWPDWFERPFWTRKGQSHALEGEEDDIERCREWLTANFDAVEQQNMPTLQERLESASGVSKEGNGEPPSQNEVEPTNKTVYEQEVRTTSQEKPGTNH